MSYQKEKKMRNIITILLILIIPAMVYSIINKDSKDLSAMAKDNGLPTLMTFTSTMCLDCQKMKAVIKELENDYAGKINFVSINATDKSNTVKGMVKKYSVVLVPTMIFINKDQNEVKRIEGAITKEELQNELEQLCNG